MSSNKYCVIMAGGVGFRLWPKSRKSMPKQFLDIVGNGKSLIRQTYERFVKMIPSEQFLVVTNVAYRHLVEEQIPELNPNQILCEPSGRNTAPSICYAAFHLRNIDPSAQMIVTPSDHTITKCDDFLEAVAQCADFAQSNDALLTLGIRPTHPDTGYGYIQISDKQPISKVKCFTEKPSLEIAKMFIQHREFFWNSGIFIFRAQTIIDAIKLHIPDYFALFDSIKDRLHDNESITNIYSECKPISIDYGVMERADNVYVRCGDFGWSDIGSWGTVYKHSAKDSHFNTSPADSFAFSSNGCMISLPEGKIAVVSGLNDYIVVDTDDILLICPRHEEQSIKKFIDEVKYNKGDKFL